LLNVHGSTEPVTYTYDALYRLSTLKDAANNTTSYFYNSAGYLYQTVYPGAQTIPPTVPLGVGGTDTLTFPSYDADGNPLQRVDGNHVTTNYAYNDPESALTDITYSAGITNVHLIYDGYGRQTSMADSSGVQSLTYDDNGYVLTLTVNYTGLATKTQTYTYWPCGRRKSLALSDLSTSFQYGYDGVGRMNSIINPNSETSFWTYYDNDWMLTQKLGNGATATYTLNARGLMTDLLNKNASGTRLSEFSAMSCDGVGSRVATTAAVTTNTAYSGTTSCQYDYGQTANPALNRSQLTKNLS
jgi:YD repeat-containing protein